MLIGPVLEARPGTLVAAGHRPPLGSIRWRRRRRIPGSWGQGEGVLLLDVGGGWGSDPHLGNRARRGWSRFGSDGLKVVDFDLEGPDRGEVRLLLDVGVDAEDRLLDLDFHFGVGLSLNGGFSLDFGRRHNR